MSLLEKEKACIRARAWAKAHPERAKANGKAWRKAHPERCNEWHRNWRLANPEKANATQSAWYEANKDRINRRKVVYYIERYRSNPIFRMRHCLRQRLRKALKSSGCVTDAKVMELVGCSVSELRKHLESLWQSGMSWSNYGTKGWHVDHKLPCASFDLSDPEQQRACFHWTNLQPLWAKDNLKKSKKLA